MRLPQLPAGRCRSVIFSARRFSPSQRGAPFGI